ncbi:GuaB3 family IMP dehydrogenase-related protein [Corynebacterium poyangense]|uniref:GuaB3 family IMP dehydrogenase-related protein n=1 Tax=Corynebacterium poyangense TaxID=2684405 RepID=A0A7H0SMA9_9CORY|nr:GuaB3 family IMP dehydrogenase-related protein [Corynebacterium poyangense]MBZ8176784.1 GuaB3 family IMP dehydrogenase-related protein [Corynebacterium poyangense]QNQ89684.1 GuaB3 family IMP dehydrogenase-related protein [Corynebacterium poyangense]
MRDYVEIGIGRQARRSYRLSQIGIVPSRRTRSSAEVDTTWHIDAYTFDIPVASHPTDALADPDFIIAMDRQGGLGVINAEGLWGRHRDLQAAYQEITKAAQRGEAIQTLQELHSAALDVDLLSERIRYVRDSGATVAVRVSPQNARELAPHVIKAGAEILFIQGTVISAEHVSRDGEPLNLKEFIGSLDIPVIAGGVSDYTTALHLMRSGAAGVIVGGGSHTNDLALGLESPMATAIADVAAARRDYLDETEGRYVHVIADGEIYTSGDVAKAIACGADAVILGEVLAPAQETPAEGWYWQAAAAHPRFPRGFVLASRALEISDQGCETVDRPSLAHILHGPSTQVWGGENIVGGLRRAMAKCGFTDLKRFQKVDLNIISDLS